MLHRKIGKEKLALKSSVSSSYSVTSFAAYLIVIEAKRCWETIVFGSAEGATVPGAL